MNSYRIFQYVWKLTIPALLGAMAPAWAQVVIPGKVPMNTLPTRVVGQTRIRLVTGAPNLVEGREFNAPSDVAVDTANKILYVVDTGNNRVLGFNNAAGVTNGIFADYVIGQTDRFTTLPGGPDATFKSGLIAPTAAAVDSAGNLYVIDGGNNRIVRYRQPFAQPPGEPILADFVIGQASVSSGRSANAGGRSAKSLAFSSGNNVLSAGLRFDAGGNLWVSDPGNWRVLRFAAGVLAEGRPSNPEADIVIGQPSFTQQVAPADANSRINLREPSGITFDSAGRLYVADALNRVLVFAPPLASGMTAQRVVGAPKPPAAGQPPLPPVNEYTVGASTSQGTIPPEGVVAIGTTLLVVDRSASRILRFPPYEQWPLESESLSPAAVAVLGQDTFTQTESKVNRGLPDPGENRFALPGKAVFAEGKVFVADTGNNRVLVFPDLSTGPALNGHVATAVLGQGGFVTGGRNLVEGREFNAPNGVAVYTTPEGVPQLFVADTNNHRILGFADARKMKPGDRADIVIGQTDFTRSLVNSPFNLPTERTARSLFQPRAVAVDKQGYLWVADTGNSRVLRYPPPFSTPGFDGTADLVLGQAGFTSAVTDPTSRTMSAPIGLAFTFEGVLTVSDAVHNRVLVFYPPFTNGMPANRVIGQPNFVTTASGTENDRFNQPRGVSIDTDDRLYVADFTNNRVQVFGRVPLLGDNPAAVFTIRTNQPVGVAVSKLTGEVWTLEGGGTRRFPKFDTLIAVGDVADYAISAENAQGAVPNTFLSAAFDQFNALYLGEAANRVSIFYPKVSACNGATFVSRTFAPGMFATVSTSPGSGCEGGEDLVYTFTDKTRLFNELPNPLPFPRELEGLQVLLDGTPAPLTYVSPFQINFLVPNNAPTTGTMDLQVVHTPTGRVISATQVQMAPASPGIFTFTYEKGTQQTPARRQIAALNEDGTINSKENPAIPGKFVSLFATGVGHIPGAPPDGSPASGLTPSPAYLRVAIVPTVVEPGPNINYSGLAPGLVGVWQINVRVPELTPPGQADVGLSVNDILGSPPTRQFGFLTSIWVK